MFYAVSGDNLYHMAVEMEKLVGPPQRWPGTGRRNSSAPGASADLEQMDPWSFAGIAMRPRPALPEVPTLLLLGQKNPISRHFIL